MNEEVEELHLREELEKYLRYWPWFLIGALFALAGALIYLRLSVPVYNTVASVIIKDEDGQKAGGDAAAFSELSLLGGMGTNKIENEIGLLKSRRMMVNTIEALQAQVEYYDVDGLKEDELYLQSPFLIQIVRLDEDALSDALNSEMNLFTVEQTETKDELQLYFPENNTYKKIRIGEVFNLSFGSFVINDNREEVKGTIIKNRVLIKVRPIDHVADQIRQSIDIQLIEDKATLLEFNLESPVKQKAEDILNQLIFEYNKEAIEDKNEVALSTARFIDERLQIISGELDTVEVGLEEFKEANNITDIEAEASMIIENASEYRNREEELQTQQSLITSMISYLEGNAGDKGSLPANLGLQGEAVNSQIQNYNDLILQRNRILSGATEQNPTVVRLNEQIKQLKDIILSSLRQSKSNIELTLNSLRRQTGIIGSEISNVPSKERRFRDISRQQNIKEALYLFLLQKREENSLSLAATSPKAKIVDHAYTQNSPVSPKPKIILVGAFLLGITVPFIFLYIRRLLNNKIERREDIEKLTKSIPIIGELPRITKGESDLIEENDRSVLAESFRILTTNLQYLLVNAKNEDKGYCIYTTSTVKGEGKTFTSINLAMTLANTGKKVVIIGADLRNPQLQRYDTESKSFLGVSDYLVNDDHALDTLINDSKFHPNLKLFLSGSIPPNPSELLRQKKFGSMLDELREQFDYVIVDTAPSMLVADTFLISQYADLIIYVTRAGYTEKRLLQFAIDSQNDGKLHDISFVINDVKTANFGYGNKYGYAYGQEKASLWERFKKAF
ncbi:polysaccharide biosynthesis tyrosine autokinase [Leeuwenhoekiella palythoae]|uniref:GumC family protein n=1 Tax=Leeuwenhoekiella TaxID=283735 RepID=UPI001431D452|nr:MULTISPECIES: tyrosine-protein kinase family protein [Leeuwenhoekiella]UBZ11048.1 polysaccharide biosynthesis tyrosine autokinase [Leeuwenhoekiella palythoae]